MSKLEELVLSFAQPAAQQIGCEAIEAEYKKEGSSYVLRVTIDRTDDVPVSMDECTIERKTHFWQYFIRRQMCV